MKKLRRVVSSSEQGFGMIDTLVATVLLGIAVVAMLAGFTYASMSTRENRERIQAIMLAQETLENLKQNDGKKNANWIVTSPPGYSVSVSNGKANDLDKLQAVTVKVAWQEAGKKRSLSMVEYIYLK
jgi:Tfp pilus assembly protein PilV